MNEPTRATIAANAAVHTTLPFGDTVDLDLVERGFLAPLPDTVTTQDGGPVWDARKFDLVSGDAPETVRPSLWRQELLSGIGGLFEVVDGIYQVRSLDLSNGVVSRIRPEIAVVTPGWKGSIPAALFTPTG